jgi:hypothetical protein
MDALFASSQPSGRAKHVRDVSLATPDGSPDPAGSRSDMGAILSSGQGEAAAATVVVAAASLTR